MVRTENDKDSLTCATYTVISLIRSQTGGPTLSRLSLRLHSTCLLSPLLIICSLFKACRICVCACMCACDFVWSWQHSAGTNKQGQSLQSDSLRLVPFSLCPFLLILSSPSSPEIYCRLFQTPRPNDRGPLGEAGLDRLQGPPNPLPVRAWTYWWG